MNLERIKEIQEETDSPHNISVMQALLKVWNECERERKKKNTICPDCGGKGWLYNKENRIIRKCGCQY